MALAGLVIFLMAFSVCVALFRGGLEGIARAYTREGYEYSHDLVRLFATDESWSIRTLFRDYIYLQPQLSLHAKVHPPGAITLLWLLSYVVGTAPLALSLATVAFGATAIVPLYYWVKDMASARAAIICAALYALMPAIVLFTATSADILFTPITLTTLFLFWRAVNGGAHAYGALAGVGYAFMSLTSFTLISIGAFFGFVGLWFLLRPARRGAVLRTAFLMTASLLLVHGAVWLWSGFDVITFFRGAKTLFDLDQMRLENLTPRFPSWTWLILNPAAWFFYAGLPLSVLCWWWLLGAGKERRGLRVAFGLTLIALNVLYLGRGEGERSALYIFPFIAVPAALLLDDLCARAKNVSPVEGAAIFLGIQCWFVESFFDTYW